MDAVQRLLKELGPTRAATVAQRLQSDLGLSAEAARKRLSRATAPVRSFPVALLPKRERFLYLQPQRTEEHFWTRLHEAMRETNSIYGAAIDGLIARGGIVLADEFAVISGAPVAMSGQVSSSRVADTLVSAHAIKRVTYADVGECYELDRYELGGVDSSGLRARNIAEGVILDGLREWARKLGLASYNQIAIRGDAHPRQVGPFRWDLTGPSYLQSVRGSGGKPGFLLADVFADAMLDEPHIRYFIRKNGLLRSSLPNASALSILVADAFTGGALRAGHAAGIVLACPANLFGQRVGAAMQTLIATLKNAAAVAAGNPAKLAMLVEELSEIEGAAGNLRGILFELIAAYLCRMDAVSVDMGIRAKHPTTGARGDIDVFKVVSQAECVGIECKGKEPGGMLTLAEVEHWLEKIPTFRAHLASESRFREARISFEIWTTGIIAPDALEKLTAEQPKRTKTPIRWKDGQAISKMAKTAKEKTIAVALENHFLKHPLATA